MTLYVHGNDDGCIMNIFMTARHIFMIQHWKIFSHLKLILKTRKLLQEFYRRSTRKTNEFNFSSDRFDGFVV